MTKNIFTLLIITVLFSGCNSASSSAASAEVQKSPEQLRMELKQQEQAAPAEYLSAHGTYKENFWGDKLKIKCTIHNNATLASFKDVIVRITFYSKTKTELGSKDYTIYEIVNANSDKIVELKIGTYKDVESIGWDVVTAVPLD
jgi:hypothetical protein